MSSDSVTFEPSGGGNYFDGRKHTLGHVTCTISNGRLTIQDSLRGGVHQFLLRDLVEVDTRTGLFGPKELRFATPANAITFLCKSEDEVRQIARLIAEAMPA